MLSKHLDDNDKSLKIKSHIFTILLNMNTNNNKKKSRDQKKGNETKKIKPNINAEKEYSRYRIDTQKKAQE